METNDILREIADELHSMNFNLCELINVLKGKQQSPKIGDDLDDALDTIGEAMRIHNEQLAAKSAATTTKAIEAEDAYLKKQANLDKALKKLGVL